MQEKVFIKNRYGNKLAGLIDYPKGKKIKYPAVLLVHGFHYHKHDAEFDVLSSRLSDKGFLVFRFDFTGCGESEGDFINESLTKEIDDFNKILLYIKSREDVDKIGVLAQSFGTAGVIAAKPDVSAIVLTSTTGDHLKSLPNLFGDNYNPDGISWKKRSYGGMTRVNKSFWEDLRRYNLFEIVKDVHVPILFIHGDKDSSIRYENTIKLAKLANNPKKEVIVKGMEHDWMPDPEELYIETIEWFNKYL